MPLFPPPPPSACRPPVIRVFQVPPGQIGFLSSLLEGCEGIGLLRTLDQDRGVIECWMMDWAEADFERLLLRRGFPVRELPPEFD